MPYLSANHRYKKRSRSRSMVDATLFVFFSMVGLFGVLLLFGWLSHGDDSGKYGYQITTSEEFLAQNK